MTYQYGMKSNHLEFKLYVVCCIFYMQYVRNLDLYTNGFNVIGMGTCYINTFAIVPISLIKTLFMDSWLINDLTQIYLKVYSNYIWLYLDFIIWITWTLLSWRKYTCRVYLICVYIAMLCHAGSHLPQWPI